MKKLLAIAAAGEAATGLALLADPPMVLRLLLGAEIAGAGMVMSRLAGIGLIGLGIACWPGRAGQGLLAMLVYGLLATLYLGYLGIVGEWVGILLWPSVGVHAVLSALLAWAWIRR